MKHFSFHEVKVMLFQIFDHPRCTGLNLFWLYYFFFEMGDFYGGTGMSALLSVFL